MARAFAARGARMILTGRRRQVLDALAREVSGEVLVCDLADRRQVEQLIETVGEVDMLIANAGHPASGVFTELDQDRIDRMIEVNLGAPIALARALAPGMAARGHGHLIFISSLSGKAAQPASAIYSATKFGLRGFALAARADLRRHGVGVSVVLPGFIRDAGMFPEDTVRLPPGVGTRSPADVAAAVLRAVERNRAEVDVAPLGLRVGASLAGLAPGVTAPVSRWLGGEKIASDVAAGQGDVD
jgi:short-subunit dehydrogenase